MVNFFTLFINCSLMNASLEQVAGKTAINLVIMH